MRRTEARFGSDFETERTHTFEHIVCYTNTQCVSSVQRCVDTENESIVANDRHKLKKEDKRSKARQHSRWHRAYRLELNHCV